MANETFIHPMAVVEDGAQIGQGVRIGPFCYVANGVTLGDNVELVSHVSILSGTSLGEGCKVYANTALGGPPQNMAHKGGPTTLTIGKNCTIREGVSMHTGSDSSRGKTTVGDNCHFMAYTHVAHDCAVGNNVTMANGVGLAGHVEIGDRATLGGLAAVHQFVRIGEGAFVGACSFVMGDIIPFGMANGNPTVLRGLNVVGLRRSGVSKAEIMELRRAYRMIFDRSHPVAENLEHAAEEFAGLAPATKIVDFFSNRGKRPYAVPPVRGPIEDETAEGA